MGYTSWRSISSRPADWSCIVGGIGDHVRLKEDIPQLDRKAGDRGVIVDYFFDKKGKAWGRVYFFMDQLSLPVFMDLEVSTSKVYKIWLPLASKKSSSD